MSLDDRTNEIEQFFFTHLNDFGGKTILKKMIQSLMSEFKTSSEKSRKTISKLMEDGEIKVEYKGNVPFVSSGHIANPTAVRQC